MLKRVALVACVFAAAGCSTTQTGADTAAANEVCTEVPVESTGSRVGTERVCRPAQ